jgi:hypothetical protein
LWRSLVSTPLVLELLQGAALPEADDAGLMLDRDGGVAVRGFRVGADDVRRGVGNDARGCVCLHGVPFVVRIKHDVVVTTCFLQCADPLFIIPPPCKKSSPAVEKVREEKGIPVRTGMPS